MCTNGISSEGDIGKVALTLVGKQGVGSEGGTESLWAAISAETFQGQHILPLVLSGPLPTPAPLILYDQGQHHLWQ